MSKTASVLIGLIFLAALSGCGKDTQRDASLDMPDTTRGVTTTTRAPTTTTTIPAYPVAGWSGAGIHAICVVQNGTFNGGPVTVEQTHADAAVQSRHLAGPNCDATLTIVFTGNALSSSYSGVGVLYTGAKATGTMTLSALNQPDLVIPIDVNVEPAHTTVEDRTDLPKDPIDALHHLNISNKVHDALDTWLGVPPPTTSRSTTTTR
jgi:hypothetical protein